MKSILVLLMLSLMSGIVKAKNLQNYIENPVVVGEARLTFMFWDVYDASLIANNGKFSSQEPFALNLKYLRDFKGHDIASRSIDEIRDLGMKDEIKLAKWYQVMQQLFPDVEKGQTITGIVDSKQVSHFYFENQALGKIEDPEFSRWFFSIWLHEDTSEPKMRAQLLGLN